MNILSGFKQKYIKMKYYSILLLITLYFDSTVSAQKQKPILDFNTTDTYLITMKDESTFTGKFVEKRDNIIIIATKSARVELLMAEIVSAKKIDESRFVNGKYWFPNPHHSRYLFSPSAFNLKKGEGYYQNIYGVINSVNYGLSDHFTLGVGTEIISLFSGFPVLMVTPKFGGYEIGNNLHAGGGAFLAAAEGGIFGIGYGMITKGTEDKNITFGLGWAFSSDGDLETKPVATISGMYRFRKNMAFISENWLVPFEGYKPFFSYGLRFFGEQIAVDIAFINSPDIARDAIAIGIPYVDFVYKF